GRYAQSERDERVRIGADHVELAVREVHDLQDAEDHGQADCHQRVEQADDQPVDEQVESEQSSLRVAPRNVPRRDWFCTDGRERVPRPGRPSAGRPGRHLAGFRTLSICSGWPGTWISAVLLTGWFTSVSW